MKNVNVYFDSSFFAGLDNPFSALPDTARTAPTDSDDHRNNETPDVRREKRKRRERKKVDPALVASLRAGIDAARAARAKVEREAERAAERAERRADPAWQAVEQEREAERAAVRAARAARLARERAAGHKTPEHWASRDAMLNARAKVGWRVVQAHEAFPAFGRMVRTFAASGEIDAAKEAASLAWVHERFVSFARAKLTRAKPIPQPEARLLERLMALEPEAFASVALVARSIMDE